MILSKRSPVVLTLGAILGCLLASSCSRQSQVHEARGIWFVHATDPHRYLWEGLSDSDKKTAAFQESHAGDPLKALFQWAPSVPGTSEPPAFILITGDFGVDPCLIPNADTENKKDRTLEDCVNHFDAKKRDERLAEFTDLFAASSVRNIYFVAGNNDLPFETADESGITYFNQFFKDVQDKLTAKNPNVRLHNMSGCQGSKGGAIAECTADIPETDYRMIGFPSYSFKNKEAGHEKNPDLQTAQFAAFRSLVDQAARESKKVLVVMHTPEIDDPFVLAQDRYDGIEPAKSIDTSSDNPRSIYSAWNVQKSLLEDWNKVLASDSVVGVLAGHLHDGHKEIYRQPYSWSTQKDYQLGFRKLFLAPPLSVKNQDGSPIQARGFSAVFLSKDGVRNRLYWYDSLTSTFKPDPIFDAVEGREQSHRLWSARGPRWLKRLWQLGEPTLPLERSATLLIALLTAFLTVVALWQIPPSDDPMLKKPANGDSKPQDSKEPSPFTTRFGATVLAGLGGLVLDQVAKTLGGGSTPNANDKWYYIVCFISFFFVLLIFLNLLRAFAEALRSRVAVIHYPLARQGRPGRSGPDGFFRGLVQAWQALMDWDSYWWLREVHWVFSLRVPLLTFFDTFISLIQGKNQTTTRAFSDEVIDQQRNVVRVASVIRKRLHSQIQELLIRLPLAAGQKSAGDVRVNISVLSADQTNVFYISRSSGSPTLPFPKISVAWVSVFTGRARWYKSSYRGTNVLLFDNSRKTIADAPDQLRLDDYYQQRDDDYEAFIVIPVPQPHRAYGSKYVKGAIHVSFQLSADFDKISIAPQPLAPVPPVTGPSRYAEPEHVLDDWCPDPHLQASLQDAVAVLGELLRGFNEVIYRSYIQPDQGD